MKTKYSVFLGVLIAASFLFAGYEDQQPNDPKYYDNAKVVRIKYVEGEGFIQRSYDEGNEEATINLPVFENDSVGTTSGRLELYLGRLNYLRLDNDTLIQLSKIPQLRKTDLNFRIEKGGIYLDIENLDAEKAIEIQTPDCGVFLLNRGVYRINVTENRRTEVYVYDGTVEVSGRESSRNVRENQKIVMETGEIAERPFYFYDSDKDDFDDWNNVRRQSTANMHYGSSQYLQNGYEDDEYELSRSGRWVYMNDYRSHVWIPYSIGSDWRPYFNGRWAWNPYYGYTWVSSEPWGWFTHHYGRWHWDPSYSWYWIPGYHWSPAWVSWFWDDSYYGWCPLSWWNTPVVIVGNRWDRNFDYRHGIPGNSRSSIIIRKNELMGPNIQRTAITRDSISQFSNRSIAFRGSAPSDTPLISKVAVINAQGRQVVYKQGGLVSQEKYRANFVNPGTEPPIANRIPVFRYSERTAVSDKPFKYSNPEVRKKEGTESTSSGPAYYPRIRKSGSTASDDGTSARGGGDTGSSSQGGGSVDRSRSRGGESSSSSGSSSGGRTIRKKKDESPSFSGFDQSSSTNTPDSTTSTDSVASSRSVLRRYRSFYSGSGNSSSDQNSGGYIRSPSGSTRSFSSSPATPSYRGFPSTGSSSHSTPSYRGFPSGGSSSPSASSHGGARRKD